MNGNRDWAWWEADEGRVHGRVFQHVSQVESSQSAIFDRFIKLAALYDPQPPGRGDRQARVTENFIASNLDTVSSVIASAEPRARFQTDDGDWSTQRTASHLSWYAEGLVKLLDIHGACRREFFSAGLKGTGPVKCYVDRFDKIRVEASILDDIIVDELEARGGYDRVRQMHQWLLEDREELKAAYPDHAGKIDAAQTRAGHFQAQGREIGRNQIAVLESWYLPLGVKGTKGYKAGRHTVVADSLDLLDEPWEEGFPFAVMRWTHKTTGWYGIGGAERIVGHQHASNKMNWQHDRLLDQYAVPTTFIRPADANIAVTTVNRGGQFMVVNGDFPQTQTPSVISPEFARRQESLKAGAFQEFGQSQMATSAMKPAGIDSGVGLREYKDQTTQRFGLQEKAYEQLFLDTVLLAIGCAKKLGDKAPVIVRKSKHGPKKIRWADVDMGEVRVQIVAASNLSRTPAGRSSFIMEMAQGGVISQDMTRRLLMPHSTLDVEREMSLYASALEDVEESLEEIQDGAVLTPEPYQNLKMIVWRGQATYLKIRRNKAPERTLENMRQYIVQAAWLDSLASAPDMAMSAGAPGPTDSTAPGAMPPTDPSLAAAAMGAPVDAGQAMTGAGVAPADLLH